MIAEEPPIEEIAPLEGLSVEPQAPERIVSPEVEQGWVVDSFGFLYADESGHVQAMDIDGVPSTMDSEVTTGCAHEDFEADALASGVDHQFLRVIGLFESLFPGGIADQIISNSAKDGSMTLVFVHADERLKAIIAEDAPLTGSDGEVLAFSTFRPYADERYHAEFETSDLEGGSVLAGPGDLRLRLNIQIVEADLFLSDAYISLQVTEDGGAKGVIQGFWSKESIVEILASTSAHLLALGYTREEFEDALAQFADGALDEGGLCQALSAAFRFTAKPAYLMTEGQTP